MGDFSAVQSTTDHEPTTRLVTLSGAMAIRNGAEIGTVLREALHAAEKVVVDLAGVTEIDLIGLQFICSLHRSAVAHGKDLAVIGTQSAPISEAMQAAGFFRRTGCTQAPGPPCVWAEKPCGAPEEPSVPGKAAA